MLHWCQDETMALMTFLGSIPVLGTYAKSWLNRLRGKDHLNCHAHHLHDDGHKDPNHPWDVILNPENDPDFIELDEAEFSAFLSDADKEDLEEILANAKLHNYANEIPMVEAEIRTRNS